MALVLLYRLLFVLYAEDRRLLPVMDPRYAPYSLTDLRDQIVTNEVNIGEAGRIFILTGPNQGGKTVYTQGVGLAQVMFQAGLYVPAQSARISPVDGIYTHFTTLEKTGEGTGRLAGLPHR